MPPDPFAKPLTTRVDFCLTIQQLLTLRSALISSLTQLQDMAQEAMCACNYEQAHRCLTQRQELVATVDAIESIYQETRNHA